MKNYLKELDIASIFTFVSISGHSTLLFVIIVLYTSFLVSIPASLKAETQSVLPVPDRPPAILMKEKDYLYHHIILKAAVRHEIEAALVKAIIMAESGYNPRAISRSGAKGLMQLMPVTAKSLGVKNIFDPEHNINGGVLYFKQLVNRFKGDLKLALAAYNAGSRIVMNYNGVPPYKATRLYIQKVFLYYEYFKNQMMGDMKRPPIF